MGVLKPIEKLDFVLNYLSTNKSRKGGLSLVSILKDTQPIINDGDELLKVLEKLEKDGYIGFKERMPLNKPPLIYFYYATFSGEYLNSQGGYQELHRKENLEKTRLQDIELKATVNRKTVTSLTWIIAVGTFVAALYYLLEILKYFGVVHK